MRVHVEDVRELKRKLDKMNKIPIEDIEFYENDKRIYFSNTCLQDWQYVGLTNQEFILTDYYKEFKQ